MKYKNNLLRSKIFVSACFFLSVLFLAGISGCGKDSPMQPSASNNVGFSAMSDNSAPGTNPQNILILKEAKVMIKDLKLSADGDHGEDEDENINVGPFVINLGLDSKLNLVTSSQIPAGNYEKVKFEIHKLRPNEVSPDPDFVDANGRYSVIAKGSINGLDFVYKSDLTANQKIRLQKTLKVTTSLAENVTFYATPVSWFYDDNANILDPTLESNRHIIDHNIRDNLRHQIRVFVDRDCDGKPDN